MKIQLIQTMKANRDRAGPMRNARNSSKSKDALLAFVTLEDGTTGVGEGWTEQSNPELLSTFIEKQLAPSLVGLDISQFSPTSDAMLRDALFHGRYGLAYAAVSALEIAIWDARGKLEGQPVYRILGATESTVTACASGGLYVAGQTPEELGEEMGRFVDSGFGGVKIKVGGAPIAEDIRRVAETRKAIGTAADLMVDARFTLDESSARELFEALKPFNVRYFEAPFRPEEVQAWRRLNGKSGFPLAGPKVLFEPLATEYFITSGAVSVAQFDPILVGGFTGLCRLADTAKRHALPVTVHNSNSFVSFLASAHFAAAIEGCALVEYHTVHNTLLAHEGKDSCFFANGYVHLSDSPGLGIDLRPEDLELA